MDKLKENLNNLLSKIRTKKIIYVKKLINPTHDWNVFLATTVVVFILGLLGATYFYMQIESGQMFSKIDDSVPDKLVRINQKALDENVLEIKNKEIERENTGKNVPVDPSI